MSYHDIVNADYYHLMEILNNDAKPTKEKAMDLADLVKILS
ncbi:hypothetical protein [Bacillus sp. mrc49]|nr:hypothetical protein [Bacillus sp. mrc49]